MSVFGSWVFGLIALSFVTVFIGTVFSALTSLSDSVPRAPSRRRNSARSKPSRLATVLEDKTASANHNADAAPSSAKPSKPSTDNASSSTTDDVKELEEEDSDSKQEQEQEQELAQTKQIRAQYFNG